MPSTERPPFEAYKGPKPFVFVSYAHQDAAIVFPELIRLSSWGVNIWYDEGIDPGNEWPDEIAHALKSSAFFIFFVSRRSADSVNCRNEVYYAQNSKKPFLCIYIEETPLDEINPGLALSIGSIQAVMRYQMDNESYKRKICKALGNLAQGNSSLPIPKEPNSPGTVLSPVNPSLAQRKGRFGLVGILMGILALGLAVFALFFIFAFTTTSGPGSVTRLDTSAIKPTSNPTLSPTTASKISIPTNPVITASSVSIPKPEPVTDAWTNSLGLKFVPAGTPGILFSMYDTRVKDFKAFKEAIRDRYIEADFTQTADDPVVNVSWDDAQAFCKWLTEKELKSGILHVGQHYRLPKDAEWSRAVGLNEDSNKTPDENNQKTPDVYPWGTEFPPPPQTGNFACRDDTPTNNESEIPNADGFVYTSPVGRFQSNAFGLFDMAGNVWQWCDDLYDPGQESRVMRGSSWSDHHPASLLSSARQVQLPSGRCGYFGFRCVLESRHN